MKKIEELEKQLKKEIEARDKLRDEVATYQEKITRIRGEILILKREKREKEKQEEKSKKLTVTEERRLRGLKLLGKYSVDVFKHLFNSSHHFIMRNCFL